MGYLQRTNLIGSLYKASRISRSAALGRGPQLLLWALGIVSLAWAFSGTQFRDGEGFLTGRFILPTGTGVALLVIGWTVTGPLRKSAFWFALALVGQAVALQLIEAGPALRYQHYKPFDRLFTQTEPLLLAFLAVQTLLIIVGLRIYYRKIWRWLRRNFKTWQLLAISLVFVLSSATVSRQMPVYVGEVIFAVFIQTVQLGTIVLMASALPEETSARWRRAFAKLVGPLKPGEVAEPGRPDRFVALAALWVFILAATLSFFIYERHPHVPDEVAYLYHARFIANGVLTLPAPPAPDAFEIYLMQVDGGLWYPSPPVGWPAALSVGVLMGAPWLVNPLLAGASVLLSYILLREMYSRRTARIAVLLLAVSPWFIFMGMNFMTHMFTLTCALVAALGVAWARRTDQARWAWLGGIALGLIALVRPMEALAVAGLLGLWAIGLGGKRLSPLAITGFVLSAIMVGATTLLYNQAITGDPTVFPIMAYTDQYFGPNSNALGFGPDRGMGWAIDPYPGHSPRDGLINANLNASSMNVELLGWSIGSLLLAAVMVFSGAMRRSDYLMLAVIVGIFAPHFFYYFSGGPDFGARYWFIMLIPAVALTARGIQFLERRVQSGPPGSSRGSALVTTTVLALSIITLVNFIPWRAVDKYHDFRGMRPDVRTLAEEYDFGRSLILVRGERHPDYASAAVYNPLNLQDDAPVYAWDRNPEARAELLQVYSDRPVWIVDGPSVTGSGYKVTEGPLPAGELVEPRNEAKSPFTNDGRP